MKKKSNISDDIKLAIIKGDYVRRNQLFLVREHKHMIDITIIPAGLYIFIGSFDKIYRNFHV